MVIRLILPTFCWTVDYGYVPKSPPTRRWLIAIENHQCWLVVSEHLGIMVNDNHDELFDIAYLGNHG